MNDIVYTYKNNIYLNITNRCTSVCNYCIKYKWNWLFRGYNLRLTREPSLKEILQAINNLLKQKSSKKYKEIVFCGYGEPLVRLNIVKKLAKYLKQKEFIVRINTNGHGNLINKRNICPELKGLVDRISISLNGSNPSEYYKFNKPKFGLKTFNSIIKFIKESKKYIKDITITLVALPELNLTNCKKLANNLKIKYKVRPYLNNYQSK